jgi:hypothetical protein
MLDAEETRELMQALADYLRERDQRMAQAGADAAFRWLAEQGRLIPAGGKTAVVRRVVRDRQGRIEAVVETVEPRRAA